MREDTLEGEEGASEPRKRLAQLFFQRCENVEDIPAPDDASPGADTVEREILRLAKDHPEIFEKDFTRFTGRGWDANCIVSPLAAIVNFRYERTDKAAGDLVSLDVFEAAFKAHPESLTALDSYGDTVLHDLISRFGELYPGDDAYTEKKARLVELVKRVVDKNKAKALTVKTPIIRAISARVPLDVISYLIECHPGDPYLEESQSGENMLSAVVAQGKSYPFDFLRGVLDKNPAAAKARNIGRYSSTVLHYACSASENKVVRLVLDADPAAAFVPARDKNLPLFDLVSSMRGESRSSMSLQMLALANPTAIFTNYKHHKEYYPSSAFSLICDKLLVDDEERDYRGQHPYKWEHLYFFMNVYRFGNKVDLSQAWKAPRFPVHMGKLYYLPLGTFLLSLVTHSQTVLVFVFSTYS